MGTGRMGIFLSSAMEMISHASTSRGT
jgi:hypothetical protein